MLLRVGCWLVPLLPFGVVGMLGFGLIKILAPTSMVGLLTLAWFGMIGAVVALERSTSKDVLKKFQLKKKTRYHFFKVAWKVLSVQMFGEWKSWQNLRR